MDSYNIYGLNIYTGAELMANIFKREAIDGGDSGVWAPFELDQDRRSIGIQSAQVYDDAGTIRLSKGRIGFDNGSALGTVIIDTITAISRAPASNGNWFTISMTVSGTTPTFTVADIAGAVDPEIIPTTFTGAWDPTKGGYYIVSTARIIAIGYRSGSGPLSGLVNPMGVLEGYKGTIYEGAGTFKYNKVINSNTEYLIIEADNTTVNFNLPAIEGAQGHDYYIMNVGSQSLAIVPDGAETIEGDGVRRLWSQFDYLHVIAIEDDTWYILGGRIIQDSGLINTSDWTDRHLGDCQFDVDGGDNPLGFLIGELITETGGNAVTGLLIDLTDNLDGTGTLTLINITNSGVVTNNNVVTGSRSGKTADINEPAGTNKNQDSDVIHNLNKNIRELEKVFTISTSGTENGTLEVPFIAFDDAVAAATELGTTIYQTNPLSYEVQSGADGLPFLNATGVVSILAAQDWYYANKRKWSR
jgi:hypothetical protein